MPSFKLESVYNWQNMKSFCILYFSLKILYWTDVQLKLKTCLLLNIINIIFHYFVVSTEETMYLQSFNE